eukprot:1159831-Pelagomonas_calceolata.AAC.9
MIPMSSGLLKGSPSPQTKAKGTVKVEARAMIICYSNKGNSRGKGSPGPQTPTLGLSNSPSGSLQGPVCRAADVSKQEGATDIQAHHECFSHLQTTGTRGVA